MQSIYSISCGLWVLAMARFGFAQQVRTPEATLQQHPGKEDMTKASTQDQTKPAMTLEARQNRPPKIKVPKAIRFQDIKQVYQSPTTEPHVLMVLHLPQSSGEIFIEVYNRTKTELGIFQFTLHSLTDEGEIEFEDLPVSWSAVKAANLTNLNELQIRTPRAFDKNAKEVSPTLIIHTIKQTGANPQVGKRKN